MIRSQLAPSMKIYWSQRTLVQRGKGEPVIWGLSLHESCKKLDFPASLSRLPYYALLVFWSLKDCKLFQMYQKELSEEVCFLTWAGHLAEVRHSLWDIKSQCILQKNSWLPCLSSEYLFPEFLASSCKVRWFFSQERMLSNKLVWGLMEFHI